ncbi:MAG: hypothetical protein EOP00_29660 [Pedobacter sp.]|nr:MAG: hypothetical protein EOP00_29660 [Pedobacter sp.]
MFNHFVKKDGYSSSSHIIAGGATFLSNIFFMGNCYFIIKVSLNNPIPFAVHKATGSLISLILIVLHHYLLFWVFKFGKVGDGPNRLFNVTRKETNFAWWFSGVNLFLLLTMTLLSSFLKEKYQIGSGY